MLPANVNGIPLHPLLVHAVVVLVPLAVLAAIALAVSGWVRDHYGWLFLGLATVATVFVPLATSSGESLEERLGPEGESAAVEHHAELGDQLLPIMIGLLVLVAALVVLHHRVRWERKVLALRVVGVLVVVMAVVTGVQIYRIGDSGASAVWKGRVQSLSHAHNAGGGSLSPR